MVKAIQGQSITCIYTGTLTWNIRVLSCSPALVNVKDIFNVLFLSYSFAFISIHKVFLSEILSMKNSKTHKNNLKFRGLSYNLQDK